MDEAQFERFLKRGGRSPSAVQRCLTHTLNFERYLTEHSSLRSLDEASPADLEAYVAWVESEPISSAKTHLWAIAYYYQFTANDDLRNTARALRSQRTQKTPFALSKFRGVDPDHARSLAQVGIRNVNQMLQESSTSQQRQALSDQTGVPLDGIVELVKLSDLARIPGMKGIRARLYYDAGVETIEQLANWEPEELRTMLNDFVEQTGFDGIAPLPKEVAHSVATARELPRVVEF